MVVSLITRMDKWHIYKMAAKYICFKRTLSVIEPLPILKYVIFSKFVRAMAESFHLSIGCFNRTSFS